MPGAAVLTPAIVVGVIPYGETSRIVRLATRDLGVQSAIAKGALRPRSRFGTTLQLLAEGTAHVLVGRGDLATLAAFDTAQLHLGLARSGENFRAASALAELAGRFAPPIPQGEVYAAITTGVALLEAAPEEAEVVVGLLVLWRLLAELGFAPELGRCVRDGEALEPGPIAFSVDAGGALCRRCTAGHPPIQLAPADREALQFFLDGVGEAPALDARHAAAHRRLLVRWVQRHLGEGELPALGSWQRGR